MEERGTTSSHQPSSQSPPASRPDRSHLTQPSHTPWSHTAFVSAAVDHVTDVSEVPSTTVTSLTSHTSPTLPTSPISHTSLTSLTDTAHCVVELDDLSALVVNQVHPTLTNPNRPTPQRHTDTQTHGVTTDSPHIGLTKSGTIPSHHLTHHSPASSSSANLTQRALDFDKLTSTDPQSEVPGSHGVWQSPQWWLLIIFYLTHSFHLASIVVGLDCMMRGEHCGALGERGEVGVWYDKMWGVVWLCVWLCPSHLTLGSIFYTPVTRWIKEIRDPSDKVNELSHLSEMGEVNKPAEAELKLKEVQVEGRSLDGKKKITNKAARASLTDVAVGVVYWFCVIPVLTLVDLFLVPLGFSRRTDMRSYCLIRLVIYGFVGCGVTVICVCVMTFIYYIELILKLVSVWPLTHVAPTVPVFHIPLTVLTLMMGVTNIIAVYIYLNKMKRYHCFTHRWGEVDLAICLLKHEIPPEIDERIEKCTGTLALPSCLKDLGCVGWEKLLLKVGLNKNIKSIEIASPQFGVIRTGSLFVGNYQVMLLARLYEASPQLSTLNGIDIRRIVNNSQWLLDLSHWRCCDGGTAFAVACEVIAGLESRCGVSLSQSERDCGVGELGFESVNHLSAIDGLEQCEGPDRISGDKARDKRGKKESVRGKRVRSRRVTEREEVISVVKMIDLHRSEVGRREASHLSRLMGLSTHIETLKMNGTGIDDCGVKLLCKGVGLNNSLKILNLRNNSITQSGAHALATVLKTHTSLRSLLMGGNIIGEVGARVLGDAMKYNDSLIHVELEWGGLGQ